MSEAIPRPQNALRNFHLRLLRPCGARNDCKFFLVAILILCLFSFSSRLPALLQGNRIHLIDENKMVEDKGTSNQCLKGQVSGEEAFGKSGTSLALDYDVETPDSACTLSVGLADLSGMSYLSFWVKSAEGKTGRLQFVVELREDTNGDRKYVSGEDHVSRVPISGFSGKIGPDGWKKVVIPLAKFSNIQNRDQILEMAFVLENRWRIGKGRMLLGDALFGSNYPEGWNGGEISMQNRVSSFKIGGARVASPEVKLKRKATSLTLTLTFIDPYLEEIRFEKSEDGGTWERIESFYDQTGGGTYQTNWEPAKEFTEKQGVLIRAVGVNLFGGQTELVGPYRLYFD